MAHRFKNEDPNFPERTKLGAKLPDRTNERSLDEVRGFSKTISRLLKGFQRRFFTDGAGNRWEFLGRNAGPGLPAYGLAVVRRTSTTVRILPSVVSGMGAWATVPKIGGNALTDSPAPELTVSGKRWVALHIEVEPESEIAWTDADQTLYRIKEGAGTLIGDIEPRAYDDEDEMEAESSPAQIDAMSGAVIANGHYVIPLAWEDDTGIWQQIGYYGPLGVRMCASGAFIALSPAKGPSIEIPEP